MKAPKVVTLNFKRIRATIAGWKRKQMPTSYDFNAFLKEWSTRNASRISRTSR